MAKPAKRKIDSDSSSTKDEAKATPAKPRVSKRVTVANDHHSKGADGHGRTTARKNVQGPSPTWVPVLMFTLFALGLVVIMLNYMEVLPATDSLSGWYLIGGLGSILGGILVATQYR